MSSKNLKHIKTYLIEQLLQTQAAFIPPASEWVLRRNL